MRCPAGCPGEFDSIDVDVHDIKECLAILTASCVENEAMRVKAFQLLGNVDPSYRHGTSDRTRSLQNVERFDSLDKGKR